MFCYYIIFSFFFFLYYIFKIKISIWVLRSIGILLLSILQDYLSRYSQQDTTAEFCLKEGSAE